MDAHLFRRFCDALVPSLPGSRVEKIHQPAPGITSIALYGAPDGLPKKRHLVLKADRQTPLLFVADHRLPAPYQPPAPIMRLRKYLGDRHIMEAVAHWRQRRLYIRVGGMAEGETRGAEPQESRPHSGTFPLTEDVWLCLDLREGPRLCPAPEPEPETPLWPEAPLATWGDSWREWPAVTPALRRTLRHLDPEDAAALLEDLQTGGGDVFLYEDASGKREISAWPLPEAQLAAMGGSWRESVWESPFEPLALAGEMQFYASAAARAVKEAAKPHDAESKRLAKLQEKLVREEERLNALRAKQATGLLLQSHLYLFGADEKAASVTLPAIDSDSHDMPEDSVTLSLDPRLTIRENMAAMFHQAGRGRRGLQHLAVRRAAVEAERAAAEHAANISLPPSSRPPRPASQTGHDARPAKFPPNVQAFRSGDGFLMLRGRDTKGNMQALKMAASHDYWVHTANGPSAHVIIRRDHAGRDVPERTLHEAGILAALKSWLKSEENADIQYSLAKNIHPMRNAGPGMVRIDKSEGSFRVALDQGLEEKLKV